MSTRTCFVQVTGAVGWRKDSIRYKKNEVYLDIIEQVPVASECHVSGPVWWCIWITCLAVISRRS